ncbi:MAG: putative glycoside hydrolase family 15 protein [Acidobacteriota bacterium]|nr:putative glycoside hydrolase family 15 protein [Acidobacteriota bacterium]
MRRVSRIALAAAFPLILAAGNPGHVYFQRLADPQLDRFTNSPNSSQKQWFRDRFFRMAVFSPYFDAKTSWYPNSLLYNNLYGIEPDSSFAREHPDWILHDQGGHLLYIPFACEGGVCPHYAADIANPAFRAQWIAQMSDLLRRFRYRGLWIDDVNLEFRVSDGYGKQTAPIDSATHRPMTWEAWRNYVAGFTEQIRRALPNVEIAQNPIWYAAPGRDSDPAVRRQIRTADNINIERGIAGDNGLTGGTGEWSLNALFSFIDRVHAAGPGVTLEEYSPDLRGKQYSLAGYFLISNGNDRIGDDSNPETWWEGYDVELGQPLGPRTWNNGVYSRRFAKGMVLLGEPGLQTREIPLNSTFTTLDGSSVTSVRLSARQGIVLRIPPAR